MADIRKRVRIPTQFQAETLTGKGTVGNIGPSGLFVSTRMIPERGESVRVELAPTGRPHFQVTGMVWWTTRDEPLRGDVSGFGLRLLDDSEELERLVDSVR